MRQVNHLSLLQNQQGSYRDVDRQGIPITLIKIKYSKNAASFHNP